MLRRLAALLALAAIVAGAPACSRGGETAPIVALDGSPRIPDDEGVVTAVSRERITIDGTRTYALSKSLRAFSTLDLGAIAVLNTKDQYVQVGLDDDRETVEWLGRIATVLETANPSVYYVGVLVRRDGERLIFRDGTVLRAPADLALPATLPVTTTVEIDPGAHQVRRLSARG